MLSTLLNKIIIIIINKIIGGGGGVVFIVSSCHYGLDIYILLICFCSFDLFCPLLDKYIFIENLYIALSCPIK